MNASTNQIIKILKSYLKKENYSVDPNDFTLQLQSNPSFPSVKSITDTLDYFGIDNIAANVPKDALAQLPPFFLAVLEEESGNSIAQVQHTEHTVKLFKEDGSKQKLSVKDFKEKWNGTLIAIEKNEKVNQQSSSTLNPLVPMAIILVAALAYTVFNFETQAIIYTTLAVIGCCCSYFIVRESFGMYNEATSKICNSAEKNTSCSDVINSNNSKLFKLVSLSDVSITFFVAIILTISLFGYNASFYLALSVLSIPVIAYTIYSQAFIIKKWCPLCLGISGVLICQAILTFIFSETLVFDLSYLLKSVALVTVVYFMWLSLKGFILKAIASDQIQTDFLKFKRNESLFNTLLKKEKLPSTDTIESSSRITFGNPNATLKITSVTNPLCGFCTKAFEAYDSLLKTHGDKFELNIIFNVPADIAQAPTQISQQIIDIYKKNPKDAYTALKEWFKAREVSAWQEKYGIPSNTTSLHTIELHKTWCDLNEINYTPATIVGNYFFPKEYEIKDLALFVDYLVENQKTVFSNNGEKALIYNY